MLWFILIVMSVRFIRFNRWRDFLLRKLNSENNEQIFFKIYQEMHIFIYFCIYHIIIVTLNKNTAKRRIYSHVLLTILFLFLQYYFTQFRNVPNNSLIHFFELCEKITGTNRHIRSNVCKIQYSN